METYVLCWSLLKLGIVRGVPKGQNIKGWGLGGASKVTSEAPPSPHRNHPICIPRLSNMMSNRHIVMRSVIQHRCSIFIVSSVDRVCLGSSHQLFQVVSGVNVSVDGLLLELVRDGSGSRSQSEWLGVGRGDGRGGGDRRDLGELTVWRHTARVDFRNGTTVLELLASLEELQNDKCDPAF